ncbi:MAG: hypothetical protein ACK46C_03725 [Flavobacteriales bacterium]
MRNIVQRTLSSKKTRLVLFCLHIVLMALGFVVFGDRPSGDQATYIRLAEGLEHGTFSYWNGIMEPPPLETYRTHGYPVFLWLVRHDLTAARVAQNVLLLVNLLLLLQWVGKRPNGLFAQNLLLLLLLPQFQLLHYAHEILPEAVMVPLCSAVAVVGMAPPSRRRSVMLGMLIALAWWVRPVLLLFPLFVLLADLVLTRGAQRAAALRANLTTLTLFAVFAPLPFALWNLGAHGVFKPVPISGSSRIANMGFWQHRLPGYGSMHYFHYNYFGREFFPWVNDDEAAMHYARYNEQWERIEAAAIPFMTASDKTNIPIMEASYPDLFVTRSARLTVALDSLIARETMASIKAEPGFYLATRLYTAARLWITNINRPMERMVFRPEPGVRPVVGTANGIKGWLGMLAPFLLSFVTFGIGGIFLVVCVIRYRQQWHERRYALFLVGYIWVIHIPMAIQSRYTVPVHGVVIALIAVAAVEQFLSRQGRTA